MLDCLKNVSGSACLSCNTSGRSFCDDLGEVIHEDQIQSFVRRRGDPQRMGRRGRRRGFDFPASDRRRRAGCDGVAARRERPEGADDAAGVFGRGAEQAECDDAERPPEIYAERHLRLERPGTGLGLHAGPQRRTGGKSVQRDRGQLPERRHLSRRPVDAVSRAQRRHLHGGH